METIRIKARSGSAGAASLSRPIKARRGSAGTPPVSVKARSGSAGTASLSRPIKARSGSDGTAPTLAVTPRSAFTLVELLVVIGIIAMLAALVTPAVMRAQATARNAAIKAEIDMLHMAIMNYKNEYGSFPPCVAGSSSRDAAHLVRLFPRITAAVANSQLAIASAGTDGTTADSSCLNSIPSLNPRTALTFWLGGFTANPVSPLVPASDRKALYSFDNSRKQLTTSNRFTGEYYSSGKPESQFWYMDSTSSVADLSAFSFARETHPTTGAIFNNDTFQIVNPGRDGVWNNDDDLSNFWPGTRKDFRDSLNQ